MTLDPHAIKPIVTAGSPLAEAAGALILLHGRGASARDILSLGPEISPEGWALLAPEAVGNTWYPYSFLAPRDQNEPFLTSALSRVHASVQMALEAQIPYHRIVIAGFSQGACLATEYVGRNPQRYGALVAFTGGLIGPTDVPISLTGDLARTPALLTSGDPDPHVPWSRVQQSADLLAGIGANVILQRHPGQPHIITAEELRDARELLTSI